MFNNSSYVIYFSSLLNAFRFRLSNDINYQVTPQSNVKTPHVEIVIISNISLTNS